MMAPMTALKNRLRGTMLAQLTQGANAEGLARTCAVAVAFGLFPLLGFTTILCFLFGAAFRLNQPVLQTVNYMMFPIQLLAIPFFGYAGSYFFSNERLDLSPANLAREFSLSVTDFFSKYGWVGFRAVVLWAIVAPLIGYGVYRACLPAFLRLEKRLRA